MTDPPPSRANQLEHWLSVGASVVAPVTVLSTLLFFFGYVSARAQYEYFGIDVDAVGLSTQSYVMRSPQPLLTPLLVLMLVAAGFVALHLAIRSRVAAAIAASRDTQLRRTTTRALSAGVLVLTVGVVLLALYPMLTEWPYYDLVVPLVVALGAGLVAYVWRLRGTYLSVEQTSTLRRVGVVILCLLVGVCVFWSTATVAQWSGRGLARHDARHFDRLPSVVLDTKERLFLRDPGVEETELPAAAGQTFHFRYRHLRLLIQGGNDRMFLVPDVWSASDSTLVVPMDGTMRVQFRFENDPP